MSLMCHFTIDQKRFLPVSRRMSKKKMLGQRRGQITISEAVAEMLEHTVCKPCSQCEVGCVMDSKGGERVCVVTQL